MPIRFCTEKNQQTVKTNNYWENTFINYAFNKGLIIRTQKELKTAKNKFR